MKETNLIQFVVALPLRSKAHIGTMDPNQFKDKLTLSSQLMYLDGQAGVTALVFIAGTRKIPITAVMRRILLNPIGWI
ncbi:MAG: hypothetical protein ACREBQ_13785 [Nitrososphaerales archaeon]